MLNFVDVFASTIVIAIVGGSASAAPPVPEPDAFILYHNAATAIAVKSPSASSLEYPDYPPFGPQWEAMAKAAWERDGTTRKSAHDARSIATAHIPPETEKSQMYEARAIANNLGDAALYQHFQKDDAGAIETLNDLMHLSSIIRRNSPQADLLRPLVAAGIDAVIATRLLVITSDVQLAADPSDKTSLQVNVAHKLIDDLLQCVPPDDQMQQLGPATMPSATRPVDDVRQNNQLLKETFSRCDAGQIMAAISLAAHLYQFEMKRWPQSLAEIVPNYLPAIPTDYWGDGKETFGYVLIHNGLPDGSDRPLVFCRCESRDGLFYRTDVPHYTFYIGDGSGLSVMHQKRGGQFYDIAAWTQAEMGKGPTTRPLVPDRRN